MFTNIKRWIYNNNNYDDKRPIGKKKRDGFRPQNTNHNNYPMINIQAFNIHQILYQLYNWNLQKQIQGGFEK